MKKGHQTKMSIEGDATKIKSIAEVIVLLEKKRFPSIAYAKMQEIQDLWDGVKVKD